MPTARPVRLVLRLCAILCAAAGVRAEVPLGQLLEKVGAGADARQTYALYVPTTFTRDRTWPVLFCFDPGARGRAPVERFLAAAEKFGWIVAGSNNSRNGPWEANVVAIQAMIGDVERHFPLDRKRLYVAGLSGGARVACQLAVSGVAHGVIACSAGFMNSETPSRVPFPFFGTAGETDFNYRELRRVDRELDERKAAHRVVIFDGGHEWLPRDLAIDALAWLELHAMRSGTRPQDPAWIAQQLAARQAALPSAPSPDRMRGLKALAADFTGLVATEAFAREAKSLAASREVREALKAEAAAEKAEAQLTERLMNAAADGRAAAEQKTIAELQVRAQSAPAPADRATARRVLQGVASGCSELSRQAMREEAYDTAAALLEMVTLLRPERSQTHYELARARALLGDRKRTLAALQNALAAGFVERDRLRTEAAFARWRKDPEFLALMTAP